MRDEMHHFRATTTQPPSCSRAYVEGKVSKKVIIINPRKLA